MNITISHQQPENITHNTIERWERHLNRCKTITSTLAKKLKHIERIRLFTGLSFLIFIALIREQTSWLEPLGNWGKWSIIGLLMAAFIALVYQHKKLTTRKHYFAYLSHYYQQAIYRRNRQWKHLDALENTQASDVFNDLGVTHQQASLDKLFGMIHNSDAQEKWQLWISKPTTDSIIEKRQNAIKELVSRRTLLLRFLHISAHHQASKIKRNTLIKWLNSESNHDAIQIQFYISIALILILWGTLAAALLNFIPPVSVLMAFIANGLMTAFTFGKTNALFEQTEGLKPVIESLQYRIKALENYHFNSKYLQQLHKPLITSNNPALHSLKTIQRLSIMSEFRHAGIFYFMLQLTLLWNVITYTGIANWHRKHRKAILESYQSLTTLETLMAVACFSLENHEFAYPKQKSNNPNLHMQDMAHPLLAYTQRIANTLDWSQDKPMILVSGSNMAGKSTFMKAIGLNILLARLGAPICASTAQFPNLELQTIIDVRDSLADGDSYFMAELKRLVAIIQSQPKLDSQGNPIYALCLFDEIMSGTNSHDRTEIFKAIVEELKKKNSLALFSTHDMKITESAKNDPQFSLYEFSEHYQTINDELVMHFDYQLKEGVCQRTNAQMILKVLAPNILNDKTSINSRYDRKRLGIPPRPKKRSH